AYPVKPIRLIVPFPPGGGTDIAARTIANKLSESVKWTFVLENKPGAGGNLGVEQAVKSPADGYTLVIGQTSNLAINPALYAKLPYDPLKDLSPVALIVSAPVVLVVATNSPHKSLRDLVAAAKRDPSAVTFASPGNGTVSHLAGELVQRAAQRRAEPRPRNARRARTARGRGRRCPGRHARAVCVAPQGRSRQVGTRREGVGSESRLRWPASSKNATTLRRRAAPSTECACSISRASSPATRSRRCSPISARRWSRSSRRRAIRC